MNIVLFLLNAILVLASTLFILSLLKINRMSDYLLGVYIVSYADIVLILELAGLFSAIGVAMVLTLQILLTIVSALVWYRNGKPVLLKPFLYSGLDVRKWLNKTTLLSVLKSPLLFFLIVSVVYVYINNALRILVVPPNNYDSLTYHLSRVGYWLQYHSFYPWPTGNLRQTIFPMNAELGVLWTILWWGTDQLAGFVQWNAVIVIMIGIYGLVRLLGYSRSQRWFAAFLWSTLVQVFYQSSTTQNDLVTASFWVVLVYFLFAGLQERSSAYFYLSGIAFGLALGVKSTSLMVLPALFVVAALLFWLYRKGKNIFYPFFAKWITACLLGFLLFGAYIYVQNMTVFGYPLGPDKFSELLIGTTQREDSVSSYLYLLRDNVGRYIYQLIDFSPLPLEIASKINPIKKVVFSSLYGWLHIPVDNPDTAFSDNSSFSFDHINPPGENASWFGPLMIFLIMAIIYQGWRGVREWDALRIALAIFPIGFLMVNSISQAWTPAKGRYYMIAIALSFPLIASLLGSATVWRRLTRSFLVLMALTVLLTIARTNIFQPIIWSQLIRGQRAVPGWDSVFGYRMIKENVPLTASMGLASYTGYRDYPLFGEHFTRQVNPAVPDDLELSFRADVGDFARRFENSDFLVFSRSYPSLAADNFLLLSKYGDETLWIRKDLRFENECDDGKWPFTKFYKTSSTAIACPQFPIIIGNDNIVRVSNGNFVPNIGEGADQGLEFGFFVKKKSEVNFKVLVDPGDTKSEQTLSFRVVGSDSQIQTFSMPFNKKEFLEFIILLKPDTYRIQVSLVEGKVKTGILKIQVNAQ